ncbi:MAG: hypothetical protein D6679_08210 [Candidatus Hydrogenedentota bacterium]|nr:MAG: hypothetical protein D6679_08210 [Candidatus Hydrogenedentota bacterium]
MKSPSSTIRLGIAGRMRVGKTTAARYLERRYGFYVCAFADQIKSIARVVGWNGEKDARGRKLLQDIGTVVRDYNERFWIDSLLKSLPADRSVAVDDMRMLLEHRILTEEAGFRTVLILRDSSLILDAPEDTRNHVTEREVDLIEPWRVIENNGTFEELYEKLDRLLDEWEEGPAPRSTPSSRID